MSKVIAQIIKSKLLELGLFPKSGFGKITLTIQDGMIVRISNEESLKL